MVFDWGFRCFSDIEGNITNKSIYAFSFLVGKHREPQSIYAKLFLPIIPIGIVAYALTLLWDNLCRNSCMQKVSFSRCLKSKNSLLWHLDASRAQSCLSYKVSKGGRWGVQFYLSTLTAWLFCVIARTTVIWLSLHFFFSVPSDESSLFFFPRSHFFTDNLGKGGYFSREDSINTFKLYQAMDTLL